MEQDFWTMKVMTKGVGLYEITDDVTATVNRIGFKNALINLEPPIYRFLELYPFGLSFLLSFMAITVTAFSLKI